MIGDGLMVALLLVVASVTFSVVRFVGSLGWMHGLTDKGERNGKERDCKLEVASRNWLSHSHILTS